MDERPVTTPESTPEITPETSSTAAPDTSAMDSILPPIKPKRLLSSLLKLVLVVIVIGAFAGGAVWFFGRGNRAKPNDTNANETPAISSPAVSTSITKITSATKHYDSSNYNLGFDYPRDWVVHDEATAKLTVTSPPLRLRTENDIVYSGQIVFAVQNQQTSIAAFAQNTAVASLQSQKIAYKTPTPNQRAQTYVSFVDYAGSAGLIDALYITGDNGYQADQTVPQSDVVQANPLVSVTFLKCADMTCKTAATPSEILMKSWLDTSLSTPLLNLLRSLVIE